MKTITTSIVLGLGLSFSALLQAQSVYQCTTADGKTTFQQTPCDKSSTEQKKDLNTEQNFIRNDNPRSTENAYQSMKTDNDARQRQREITKTQQKIDRLEQQRSQALTALRNKKLQASYNLAGATWEQSISTEMQSINHEYDSKIANEREYLKRLEKE